MTGTRAMFCFVLTMYLFIYDAESQFVRRPNIVILMTDDQDVMLDSMNVMNETKRLLSQTGVEFENAFTTSPICCPSRSSILTGLYTHNHGVYTNNNNCSSILWQRLYETKSYATYLNRSGYQTGYFGKYLNEYNGSYTPPGWNYWMGLVKNSRYYNYTLIHNGVKEPHGDNYEKDYLTDLVTNRSMDFFTSSKREDPERPVLTVLSYPAPHGPEDGAPQYQNLYENATSHITGSFDHVPNPFKHWIVRQSDTPMDQTQVRFSQILQQKRLQTLRSVDDGVKKVIDTLRETNELDNTYIMYFSDHGYHIGQFGLPKGKSMPYEFDVRIPFLLRGPNIPKGLRSTQIALNIDIAPTILGMAGLSIPEELDGRNLLDIFDKRKLMERPWRDSFLIERGKMPRDRAHLVKPKLAKENKVERLRKLCASPNYKNPCEVGQFWTCTEDGAKRRLQKCRPEKKPSGNKRKNRKKKYCTCPASANGRSGIDGASRIPLRCGTGYDGPGHGKTRNGGRNRLSKRNSYKQYTSALSRRVMTAYNNLRKRGPGKASRKRLRRDTDEALDVGKRRNNDGRTRDSSMVLTSKCRLYMPNFEIRCMEDLYNNPYEWVKHMGHLARSVKTLQIRMKYMKALRSCLNKYDEGVRKKNARKCECPPPATKPPKVRQRTFENATHPLSGLSEVDPLERQSYDEKLREYREHRDKIKLIKEMRQAKLARIEKRKEKGRLRSLKKCGTQGMSCFKLTTASWANPPRWDGEERCYCTNSNNNTYWCLRIINEHTNGLYCHFITGFVEFYNLNVDPHQLVNNEAELGAELHSALHNKLAMLRGCRGSVNCSVGSFPHFPELSTWSRAPEEGKSLVLDAAILNQAGEGLPLEEEGMEGEYAPQEYLPLDPMEAISGRPGNVTVNSDNNADDNFDITGRRRRKERGRNRSSAGRQAKGPRSRKRKGSPKNRRQGKAVANASSTQVSEESQVEEVPNGRSVEELFQTSERSPRKGRSRSRPGRKWQVEAKESKRSKKKRKKDSLI